jgi:hypothetical protein
MSEPTSNNTVTTEITYDTFRRQVELLISSVSQAFKDPGKVEEIEQAEKLFFAVRPDRDVPVENLRPIDQNNFIFWLLLDYKLKDTGETPMESYLKSPEAKLVPEEARQFAGKLSATKLSLYDVISVDAEKNIISLRDLFTLGLIKVEDPQLVRLAHSPVFFGIRVMKVGSKNFAAGEMYFYPKEMQGKLLQFLKESLVDPRALVPPAFKDLQKKKSYLFNHMQLLVQAQGEYMRRASQERSSENHPPEEGWHQHDGKWHKHEHHSAHSHEKTHKQEVVKAAPAEEDKNPVRAHFIVEDFSGTRGILDKMTLVLKQKDKENENSSEYLWYKTPSDRDKGQQNGIIKLSGKKVIIETEGIENLEAAKNMVSKELKSFASHLYDELEKRRNFSR